MGPAYVPLSQSNFYTPPHFTHPTLPHTVTTHSIITTPTVSTVVQPGAGGVQQMITSKPVTETEPSIEAALHVSEIEAGLSNDQDASEKDTVEDLDSELKSLSLDDSAYTSEERSRSNSGDSSPSSSEESKPVNLDNIFVKRLSPQQRRKPNVRRRNHSYKNNYTHVQPILSPPPYHHTQSIGLLPYPAPNYPPGGYVQW